jgi:uncharacterized protein DUF6930
MDKEPREELGMSEAWPTEAQWRELIEATGEFRRLGSWKWMFDSDVFGVRDPQTGEVGYCCVLGRLRQVIGLVVYRGADGIAVHERIQTGDLGPGNPDLLHLQRCLMLSFENKEDLEPQDVELVRKLGIKGRGARAFPQFRSYRPGYLPWTLTGEEARLLTLALRQTLEVALQLREKRDFLEPPREGQYLVRRLEGGQWIAGWEEPGPRAEELAGAEEPFDEVRVQRIKKASLPRRGLWEADFFFAPAAVQDAERPYYPYLFLLLNTRRPRPLGMRLARPEEHVEAFRSEFLSVLEREGALPREVQVQSEAVLRLLEPLAVRLGIRLEPVEVLQTLSFLRAGLTASLMAEREPK